MKLQRDEPLSNFAFNFNLRRYIVADAIETYEPAARAADARRTRTGEAVPAPAGGGRCALGELFHKHRQNSPAGPYKPRGLKGPHQALCDPYFTTNTRPDEAELGVIARAIYAPLDNVRQHFKILRRRARERRGADLKLAAAGVGGGDGNGEDKENAEPPKKKQRVYRQSQRERV